MKTKKMYAVEYTTDGSSSYDIFETYDDALKFANSNDNSIFLFEADFNVDRIYKDSDNNWNYNDSSDTYSNYHVIETYY